MIEVGASLKASIRSAAGFGTLVMAVVMVIKTVPSCGSGTPGTRAPDQPPHDDFGCGKTISIPLEQV
jgi:hypothetical protein